MCLFEGYTNEERCFKTVSVLDLPLLGQCLQQITTSCHNNLKLFALTLAIIGKTHWYIIMCNQNNCVFMVKEKKNNSFVKQPSEVGYIKKIKKTSTFIYTPIV